MLDFPPTIRIDQPIQDVFTLIREYPNRSFFPVLTPRNRPLGLIRESDFRAYAYSSYGRSLLENPLYTRDLTDFIQACPVASGDADIETLQRLFEESKTHDGIIITQDEIYQGFINPRVILRNSENHHIRLLRDVNSAYQQFVPAKFLELLDNSDIRELHVGACRKKEMSILFSDIRSFTSLSETMSPEENFKFLNSYFSRMEPSILAHGGYIDKYLGDGVMALFESADGALLAGLHMLNTLHLYNRNRIFNKRQALRIGIGVNTGDVMLGTIGGRRQITGTVISDAVNSASRTEELTKTYGVPLLMTREHFLRLEEPEQFSIRFIDSVQVRGKKNLQILYEIFDADPPDVFSGKIRYYRQFDEAVQSYHAGEIRSALKLFLKCEEFQTPDPVVDLYLHRCRARLGNAQDSRTKFLYRADRI